MKQPAKLPTNRMLLLTAAALFGQVIANADDQPLAARVQQHGMIDIFEERIIASNVREIRRRAFALSDEDRFNYLARWVLPSETHSTIRMSGEFTQTDPSPVASRADAQDDLQGGILVSPVFDLLDLAATSGRLQELLDRVESVPGLTDNEQLRARAAMILLLHLELNSPEAAEKTADQLLHLVRQSAPEVAAEMWPETLVVHRGVVQFGGHAAIDDLLSYLFSQRSQRENPPGLLAWHNQIASLAGRNGHVETPKSDSAPVQDPKLTQWIPVSRLRSLTRGLGLPQAAWSRSGDRVNKTSGHDEDYLFFRSPLQGDYEMECDLSPSASQAMVAGTLLGNDGNLSRIWVGTMRDGARMQPVDFQFSGFGQWVRYRCVVHSGVATVYLNGHLVRTEKLSDIPDPWVSVRSWSRSHGSARDIRITGRPVIPDSITLSASSDLRGWYPYHDEPVGSPVARWKHVEDRESTGVIVGIALAPQGASFESLLAYQRPLEESGAVDYQFFYDPGILEVHPALDRMAFVLKPEGVFIHWVTDNQYDPDDVPPDNLIEEKGFRRGPAQLPLKPNAWNRMRLGVNGSQVSLVLNGQLIYEGELVSNNRRTFGLFHFADQSEVRVRSVTMEGNWPKALPAVGEQELADQAAIQLDADFPKLKAVFAHDFSTGGLPSEFFATADSDQRGQLTLRPDGAFVVRPGGGSWLDRNIRLPFAIYGDFDIEASFDQFTSHGDRDGCIMLVLQLDDEQQHQCRLLRVRTEAQLQQLHASLSIIHNDGGRSFAAQDPSACESFKGRLRLARRGVHLHYLFAEHDSQQFRLLGTETVSDKPSVTDTLLLHTLCNGGGETQVLWKSITLRAERMTLKPGTGERPPISLYTMNSDGSGIRMLAAPPNGFNQIASAEWSADGTQLVGDMSQGGVDTSRIVILQSNGSGIQDLGPGCMPSLSPDNSEIVFSQPGVGIMRMKADGSDRRLLESNGWGTQWSPDGRHIAWASGNNIVLLDTRTNTRRQLLTSEQSAQLNYIYWNLGWSSDSNSIAFKARLRDQNTNVVAVADADKSSGFGIVFAGPDNIHEDFGWHPDAKRVLFSVLPQPMGSARLTTVHRETLGGPEILPGQPADWNVLGGDWSPDGKHIVFAAQAIPQPIEWTNER